MDPTALYHPKPAFCLWSPGSVGALVRSPWVGGRSCAWTLSRPFLPVASHATRSHRRGVRPVGSTTLHAQASAIELARAVQQGERTAVHVTEEYLDRAVQQDELYNAFISIDAERALDAARAVDSARKAGRTLGPLAGVPVAIKDNICVKQQCTTAGSQILENFISPYSATAVERLQHAGAVILGKTNLDEFGMGSSTENSAFGATKNPADPSRVPGGSSGGSAAAVAAGCCPIAIGTDTGGSIRQPASFCDVVGMKASYGRVSRHGLLSYASSLDTIGPLTTCVADSALVLQIMAGKDAMDGTSLDVNVPDYLEAVTARGDLSGVRIGVITESLGDGVDPAVADTIRKSLDVLASLGAVVKNVSLPTLKYGTPAYYVIATSEASANLARYDGIRYGERDLESKDVGKLYTSTRNSGLGREVKRRIMLGTFALSSGYYDAFYLKAQKVRSMIAADYKKMFESEVDLLVSAVAPSPAYSIGDKTADPIKMYIDDLLTVPASLAGIPSLSVPCGSVNQAGLPVGLQITGNFLQEGLVLRTGALFEHAVQN